DGNTTTWTYDNLNRIIQETNELDDSRYFSYDAAGNLTGKTDRLGRVTEYVYDPLNRLISENWLDGEDVIHSFSYTYDAGGNMLTAIDDGSSFGYEYDGLGRVTYESQSFAGFSPLIEYNREYSALGSITTLAAVVGGMADFANSY